MNTFHHNTNVFLSSFIYSLFYSFIYFYLGGSIFFSYAEEIISLSGEKRNGEKVLFCHIGLSL